MVNALFTALALIAAGQAETSSRDSGMSGVRSESAAENWRRTFPARKPRRRAEGEAAADAAFPPR